MILDNTYASFINLDHRKDRLNHMTAELSKAKIEAVRTRGMLPNEYKANILKKTCPKPPCINI